MKEPKEERVKPTYTPGGIFGRYAIEQVDAGCYCVYDVPNRKFLYDPHGPWTNYVVDGGDVLMPLPKVPWSTPHIPKTYDSTIGLWHEIYGYIHAHVDLPEEELYDVLTNWTFATWISEVWTVVPYLFFHAPVASGKTRAMEVLQRICYRGMLASNISSAALYRASEAWKPTVFLDETEIYSKEARIEVLGLLNSGYRRGQYAVRCRNTEHGTKLEVFDVFGFKALAGTEAMRDTLESRSILIQMMKNVRDVERFIDEDRAGDLRDKLLRWRFNYLSDKFDRIDRFDPSDPSPRDIPPQLKGVNGRTFELFHCLINVCEEGRENIVEYAKKLYEKRLDVEESSLEAEILQCILDCEILVENGFLETKAIAERFNMSRNDKEKWKTSSIGRLIRRLGLDKKRGNKGQKGWRWDSKRIAYLKKRYFGRGTPLGKGSKGSERSKPSKPPLHSFAKPELIESGPSTVTFGPFEANRVKPAEQCTNCSNHPVEWIITTLDGLVRRCQNCFTVLKENYLAEVKMSE